MLYLPPGIAHHGIAESECLTWSIGFRAPSDRDFAAGFLDFLDERMEPRGRYRDPGAPAAARAGEIPAAMVRHVARTIQRSVRWSRADLRDFTGRYLSEPKHNAVFEPPAPALSRAAFERRAAATGLRLDPRSRLLFSGTMLYMNGEAVRASASTAAKLRSLADERKLAGPLAAPTAFWDAAHAWYRQGFVHPGGEP